MIYYGAIETNHQDVSIPERNLICAMIIRAWADLGSTDDTIFRDSYKWVNGRKTTRFSFYWCSMSINLCPLMLRRKILSIPFSEQVNKLQEERHGNANFFVSYAKLLHEVEQ